MTDSISFGKGKKAGKIDLTKVKAGLTKEEIAGNNKKLQSIFDKVDSNIRDGVLDQTELNNFYKELNDLAGEDNELTDKEAKGFKDNDGHKMGRRHRKAFYEFLNKLAEHQQDPAAVQEEVVQQEQAQTPAPATNQNEILDQVEETVVAQNAGEIVPESETGDNSPETVSEETVVPAEPEEEAEPEVTTGIVVQNGESPAAIAKKFGVPLQDLLDANEGKLKGKGKNKYFLVGAEIVIPRKIEADELAELTKNRKSAEETTGDYAQAMAVREQKRAEAAAQREAQYKEMGLINHEGEGEKITFKYKDGKTEEYTVIGQAGRGRKLAKNKSGKIVTISHNNKILKNEYVQNTEKYEAAREFNKNLTTRKNAEKLAKQFYQIADENSGNTSMNKMAQLLDANVNEDNIVAFLDAYSKDSIKKGDSSIVDTITSEVSASESQQRKVLVKIMNKLTAAAKKAGVSNGDINKAVQDFNAAMNKEFSAHLRRTNPLEMENAIDFLRGAIVAKRTGNSGEMTDAQAIAAFNSDFSATASQVQKDYADARAAEGWAAGVGDTVCGWFGCKTVEEMDKKLGANSAAVKKLATAKTEAEFKTAYKEVFGIEFDKNKIAARDTALGNYQQAQGLSSTINITSGILKKAGNLDYTGVRNEIKSKFQLDDQTVDQIIQNLGLTSGKEITSDSDKQAMLMKFLQETQNEAAASYRTLTKGKTLEQMGKDLELLHNSAFGTNNISKEVAQFNENMAITEMVTEGVFEVAGTIALQFVPGLGQAAAARLAVSAARWGSKAVKVANAAAKAEKAFAAVNKFQTGARFTGKTQKAVQISSQMLNAGVATATVDASNGRDAKTVMRKTLMNMSFAGVGASSSMLAPKLMQSFGITNKALANEIAEEIMNAAGSYGISKIAGDDYGSTDAFIDFATGIIMSRISHIKTGANTPKSTVTDLNPPSHDAEIVNNSVHNEQRQADHHAGYLRKRQQEADKLAVDMDPDQNIVTPEQQAAYDREIAYQPVPEADRPAFEAHQKQVAADYAEAHELGNMVDASSADALQRAKANIEHPDAPTPAPVAPKPDAPVNPNQAEIDRLTQSLADLDNQIKRAETNLASKTDRRKQVTPQEKQQLERMKANRAARQAELDALQRPAAEPEVIVKPDEVADGEGIIVGRGEEVRIRANADETPDAGVVIGGGKQDGSVASAIKTPEFFAQVENLKAKDIQKFLRNNDIEPLKSEILSGNGTVRYEKDGINYQMHYEDGELTAVYIKDSQGNQNFYKYSPDGTKTQIGQEEFLTLKKSSNIKREQARSEILRDEAAPTPAVAGTRKPNKPATTMANTVGNNPRLNRYTRSARNGQKAVVTNKTYQQIDNYLENLYKQEYRRLKVWNKKNGNRFSDNELKMEARMNAERVRPSTPEEIEHFAWVQERQDLFKNMHDYDCWSGFTPKDQHHGAWKMHMYSVNEQDWRDMCDVIIPYLRENDIDWKTFNTVSTADCLNGGRQQGKAFTIYPRDNAHMEQVAKELDYIIRNNQLNTTATDIVGDRALGDNGRLFYRYEFKSGRYKDEILDLGKDYQEYHQRYDSNRGPGRYLANDMTPADDPWLNFDPSNPNSKVGQAAPTQPQAPATAPRGRSPQEIVQINEIIGDINNAKTPAAIDKIQVKLDRLPESHPHKAELQRQLREKSRALRGADPTPAQATPAKADANQANNWEMVADSRSRGFKRNANAKTNITTLTPDEVSISGNINGYSHIAGTPANKLGVKPDIYAGISGNPNLPSYSVYNADANVTAIGVFNNDTFNRPGLFQILIKGQVSEADATALMKIVRDKKLIPDMKDGFTPEVQAKARQIQEVTADYFNSKNTIEAEPYIVDVSDQVDLPEAIVEAEPHVSNQADGPVYEINEAGELVTAKDDLVMVNVDEIVTRTPREISSAIDTATTDAEFTALQNEIDAITDPAQKRALQAKLDRKRQQAMYPDLADYNQSQSVVNNEPFNDPTNDLGNLVLLDNGLHSIIDDGGAGLGF